MAVRNSPSPTGDHQNYQIVCDSLTLTTDAASAVLPAITNLLIKFEKYDAPATQFQMETSRLYFGKILNALVLMYTGANSYVGGSQLQLPGVSAFWMAAQSGDACAYGVNPDPTYATKASGTSSDWPCPVSATCSCITVPILCSLLVDLL
eukprot:COSAG02_NODE_5913_length_3942_cov_2.518345_3_plen_150_part_00